ncbi:hypothetical protein E2C01_035091 [Portunus trituberculatus]|uniref:Uncharacterized protein n=1 Tax=Portunus trituberculatus TaxID=210409 RepID=A0A5B7F8T1_PORTR|nr:hypothetical protein [Portunus trituberculatus]
MARFVTQLSGWCWEARAGEAGVRPPRGANEARTLEATAGGRHEPGLPCFFPLCYFRIINHTEQQQQHHRHM